MSVQPRHSAYRPGFASRAAAVLTLGWSGTPHGRLFLRRAASRSLRWALRLRSRPLSVATGSTALVLSPHPDDESFGCGGLLALLARDAMAVHIAFVTDGSGSHPGHSLARPSDVARLRVSEARAATGVLGVDPSKIEFLGARDGTLAHLGDELDRELLGKLSELMARIRPAAVLLPCRRDGSSEHDSLFKIAARAAGAQTNPVRMLEFPVWAWWNPLLLLGPLFSSRRIWRVDIRSVLDAKARALASYASQTLPLPPDTTAALPPAFASLFLCGEEFFFEK